MEKTDSFKNRLDYAMKLKNIKGAELILHLFVLSCAFINAYKRSGITKEKAGDARNLLFPYKGLVMLKGCK